jgi:hypothetical protein
MNLRGILLLGLLLSLIACTPASNEEIPTVMALPTVTATTTPAATPPVVTLESISSQILPTATRVSGGISTPLPSLTPESAAVSIDSVTLSQATVTANTNENCTSLTTRVVATVSSLAELRAVTLKWNYFGRITSSPGTDMQPVAGTNEFTLTLGPFDRPGPVMYWVTAEDQAGNIAYSGEFQLDVAACTEPTMTPTRSSGPILTDTPYYGEERSIRATDKEIIVPLNTPTQINLSWQGGFPPIVIDGVTNPANGLLTGGGVGYVYTPNLDFTGTDRFTFRIKDSTGQASTGVITLRVGE